MAAGRNVATIDFGVTPVDEASFTITDAAITAGMVIECFMSGGDSTADNNSAEHKHAAESLRFAPSLGLAGSFTVDIYATMELCFGTFKMQYAYAT